MDEWRGCEWERNMNYHRSAWLHIEDWTHSNQQSFQHGSRLAQHWMICIYWLHCQDWKPPHCPDEMLNVCWMFNVPANILRTLCSSQFWCVDCHTNIFFKTTSTPRGNFRWVLRWIPEKDQLYRWFLYVLCFIWSFPNTTVAVGFHLRWTPFYFKGAWLLIKSFIVIMCRQHAIKTLLENWLKTSYLSFITTVTSCFIKFYMGVSKNRGTPKWMLYNGKPY